MAVGIHDISLAVRSLSFAGAYCYSSAAAQRMISIPLSKSLDARVFGKFLSYRTSSYVNRSVSHRLPSRTGNRISRFSTRRG